MVLSYERLQSFNRLLGLDNTYTVFFFLRPDKAGNFKIQVQSTYEDSVIYLEAEILVLEGLDITISFGCEPVDRDVVHCELEIKTVVSVIESVFYNILTKERKSVSSSKASSEKFILKYPSITTSSATILLAFKADDPCKVDDENLPNLSKDFEVLLDKQKFSDTTIYCSGQLFDVHRAILAARLPKLEDMIKCETISKKGKIFFINDMTQETMTFLLRYLYSDKVEDLTIGKAEDLLAASYKYGALKLKEICSKFLQMSISLFNIFHILEIADLYEDENLRNASLELVCKHYNILKGTNDWRIFTNKSRLLADEVLRLVQKRLNSLSLDF